MEKRNVLYRIIRHIIWRLDLLLSKNSRYAKWKYDRWHMKYRTELKANSMNKGEEKKLESNDYIVAFDKIKSKFYLPLYQEDLIQQTILVYEDYFEADYLNKICNDKWEGKVGTSIKHQGVLDIGANIGNHTLYFANECSACKVFSFEPVESTFNILKRNVEINNLEEVCVIYNVGVGSDENQRANIEVYDSRNIGGTSLSLAESGTIPIVAIDRLEFERPIAFVKIDTEGFERMVIDGAKKTIETFLPFIMIEISKENFQYIDLYLENLGYAYEQEGEENFFYYIPSKVC